MNILTSASFEPLLENIKKIRIARSVPRRYPPGYKLIGALTAALEVRVRVRVFRNLNRGGVWSVQMRTQGVWRTVAHAASVAVENAGFHASEASRIRCVATRKRNVHAWIEGDLAAVVDCASVAKWSNAEIAASLRNAAASSIADLPFGVTYKPFVEAGFRLCSNGEIVTHALRTVCTVSCTIDR